MSLARSTQFDASNCSPRRRKREFSLLFLILTLRSRDRNCAHNAVQREDKGLVVEKREFITPKKTNKEEIFAL